MDGSSGWSGIVGGRRLLGGIVPYRSSWLGADLLAGATLAAVAIPEGLGYAKIAGMPPEAGLYTCLLPVLCFALFASTRRLVIGADSATAAISAAAVGLIAVGDPADLHGVEQVEPAPELLRTLIDRLEKIREGRDRAIVQIRCGEPDSVQRHRGVAVGLLELRELPAVVVAVRVVRIGRRRGPHIEAMPIGADFLERDHAPEATAALFMALRALCLVNRRAGGSPCLVDRQWVLRRLQ